MTRYYLPISAFVFPEVAGAEAISPTAGDIAGVFVGRSSYPTNTTGAIPVNPIEKVLILYSAPVTWGYREGSVMDYPLVIELPKEWIDDNTMVELKLPSLPKGVLAWAYSKTIFFGEDEPMRYLFRTEVDKNQQLNRLLPFKEIKSLGRISMCCDSFERTGLPISELPDEIADEIADEILRLESTLGFRPSQFQEDLLSETRCGACLGHVIAVVRNLSSAPIRIEDSPRLLSDCEMIASAKKIANEIQDKINQLSQVLSDGTGCEYDPNPTYLKPVFKFKGRECQRLWPSLDPMVKRCVDFIARYPRPDWNWFGDEERFVFMRELWNRILQPMLVEKSPKSLDAVRDEVFQICRHFKNPNEAALSFEDVRSPLLQALYFALDCPRETEKMGVYLERARHPEFCLAVFGALSGYAYFSRTLFPSNSKVPPPPVRPNDLDSQPKKMPLVKVPDVQPVVLPEWALKFPSMLREIFSARKIAPKRAKELMDSFSQATQESGSADKLLAVLSKKKGWSKRTHVYKDVAEIMSTGGSTKSNGIEEDLFAQADSKGACVVTESTNMPFIEDPELVRCLEMFLTHSLAMDKARVNILLENARFLQRGYAPGGLYANDSKNNLRDNKSTIRHYGNLVAKKTHLPDAAREAILRFLAERYK